eukprot:TRINITY_DN17676_c0_g1_i1.p2 TRINITY_DN17676_c0_g1~~TRINITY_DN17676_c0_g1_i1.p2  ORF type:complete len:334 (+),score=32.71 TRINITY_DN17676_c0_g1_i1:64-1065(+)
MATTSSAGEAPGAPGPAPAARWRVTVSDAEGSAEALGLIVGPETTAASAALAVASTWGWSHEELRLSWAGRVLAPADRLEAAGLYCGAAITAHRRAGKTAAEAAAADGRCAVCGHPVVSSPYCGLTGAQHGAPLPQCPSQGAVSGQVLVRVRSACGADRAEYRFPAVCTTETTAAQVVGLLVRAGGGGAVPIGDLCLVGSNGRPLEPGIPLAAAEPSLAATAEGPAELLLQLRRRSEAAASSEDPPRLLSPPLQLAPPPHGPPVVPRGPEKAPAVWRLPVPPVGPPRVLRRRVPLEAPRWVSSVWEPTGAEASTDGLPAPYGTLAGSPACRVD